jgi:AcrR family transcriptional regulator
MIMGKNIENKLEKENKLLNTAFKLFTQKGVDNTSIQDIADNAGVGKGTFYLYFKDKYDIRDKVIADYSQKLFSKALVALDKSYIQNFEDQIVFIINYIIDELTKNKIVLKLVSKNLSLGLFNSTISKISNIENDNESIYDKFVKKLDENNIKLKNPKVTLSTIIELVSSTAFNSIMYDSPLPIEEYKPYLYSVIRTILKAEI